MNAHKRALRSLCLGLVLLLGVVSVGSDAAAHQTKYGKIQALGASDRDGQVRFRNVNYFFDGRGCPKLNRRAWELMQLALEKDLEVRFFIHKRKCVVEVQVRRR